MLRSLVLAVLLVCCAGLGAQTLKPSDVDGNELTVREVWDNVTTLFGTGHSFTADDFARLKAFRQNLLDAGEDVLAGDLDLLMLAAARENAAADEAGKLDQGTVEWKAVQEQEKRRYEAGVWEITRNTGLVTFVLSTISTLALGGMMEHSNAAQGSLESDFYKWGTLGSGVVLVLSLVPLVTGETAR